MNWAVSKAGHDIGPQVFREVGERGRGYDVPWCAAMVRDVLLWGDYRTPVGWDRVFTMRDWTSQQNLLHHGLDGVQRGDNLISNIGDGHTGIALGPLNGGHVQSVAGNSSSHDGQMAVQTMGSDVWNGGYIPVRQLLRHPSLANGGGGGFGSAQLGVAASAPVGSLVQSFHLEAVAGFVASALVILGAVAMIIEFAKANDRNVAYLEQIADDPTLADRDPMLAAQLQLWKMGITPGSGRMV